jgi:hypothetical protein
VGSYYEKALAITVSTVDSYNAEKTSSDRSVFVIDLYRMDSLYAASTCASMERGKHRS